MMRLIMFLLFAAQLFVLAYIFGTALHDARQYKTPFGKLFLPYKTQVILCLWLFASLFCNVWAICLMK